MKHDNTDNFQLSELQTNQECLLECVNMYASKGFDFDELFPCDLNADTMISGFTCLFSSKSQRDPPWPRVSSVSEFVTRVTLEPGESE